MKTIEKLLYTVMCGALLLAVAGCSDDDYKPGNEVGSDNMGVYFPSSNASEYIKDEADDKSVQVRLVREHAEKAASVPIEVKWKTDNIEVPATVEFAEGETETYLTVTYTNLTTSPQCEISIPEEYANPYKEKDGSTTYIVAIYRLKVISENVTYKPNKSKDLDLFSGVTSAIYQYEGQNIFLWRNFMGSGIELKFKINGTFDKEDLSKCYGEVYPLNHCCVEYEEDSNELLGWYFNKDADSGIYDPMTWTPEGSDTGVEEYMFFYYQYNGYAYFYIDFTSSYAFIDSSVIDVSGKFNSYYITINQ